jgi:phosphoglycerate-specific signal transduction histidine kinase
MQDIHRSLGKLEGNSATHQELTEVYDKLSEEIDNIENLISSGFNGVREDMEKFRKESNDKHERHENRLTVMEAAFSHRTEKVDKIEEELQTIRHIVTGNGGTGLAEITRTQDKRLDSQGKDIKELQTELDKIDRLTEILDTIFTPLYKKGEVLFAIFGAFFTAFFTAKEAATNNLTTETALINVLFGVALILVVVTTITVVRKSKEDGKS